MEPLGSPGVAPVVAPAPVGLGSVTPVAAPPAPVVAWAGGVALSLGAGSEASEDVALPWQAPTLSTAARMARGMKWRLMPPSARKGRLGFTPAVDSEGARAVGSQPQALELDALDGRWIAVLAAGVIVAGLVEAFAAWRGLRRRWLYAYLAWLPVAMLGVALVAAGGRAPLDAGLWPALALGPIAYPLVRGLFSVMVRVQTAEIEAYRENGAYDPITKGYEAKVFDDPAEPAPRKPVAAGPAVTDTALSPPAATGVLARLSGDERPGWVRGFEGAIVAVGVCLFPLVMFFPMLANTFFDQNNVPARREMVVAQLSMMGLENVRLKRDWIQLSCTGGDGELYDWTSDAADGQACVRNSEVQIKVTRSRLTKDPFRRP